MRHLTLSLALLAGGALPAEAQQLFQDCTPLRLETAYVGAGEGHPALRFPREIERIRTSGAADFIRALRNEVATALPGTSTLRAPFLRQFDAMLADLAAIDPVATIDSARFMLRQGALDSRFGALGEEDGVHFFRGTPDAITLPETTPIAERQAACWAANLAVRTVTLLKVPAINAALATLEANALAWARWESESWSLYPWESLANSLPGIRRCAETSLGPPRCTLALAHPAVGVVLSGPTGEGAGFSDWRSRQEVIWDVLGLRTYDARGRSRWGVAIIALVPADLPASIGGAISFGRLIQVGWVPPQGPAGSREARFALSLDAFQYLANMPEWLAERRGRVRTEIGRGKEKLLSLAGAP